MRTRLALTSLLFCIIPVVGLWEGGSLLKVGIPATGNYNAQVFLPSLNTDFSDLDVRDSQNRPIKDAKSQQEIASLFLENLFHLTVVAEPHALRQAWAGLETFSHLFHNLIFDCGQAVFRWLDEAIPPPSKRFVHNVNNLWTTISVGVLLSLFLGRHNRFQKAPLKVTLRC